MVQVFKLSDNTDAVTGQMLMPTDATTSDAEQPIKRRFRFRFRFSFRTAFVMFLATCTLFGWMGRQYLWFNVRNEHLLIWKSPLPAAKPSSATKRFQRLEKENPIQHTTKSRRAATGWMAMTFSGASTECRSRFIPAT